jgi:hypothetical protein
MDRGVIYVASPPASPEREAEFNLGYDEVQLGRDAVRPAAEILLLRPGVSYVR